MKKIPPLYFFKKFKKRYLLALSLPLLSYANGFKIQEQSLNGTALGSAYVAGARGADASFYNPANMGFTNDWGENKSEFEMTTTVINIPAFKFQVPTTNQGLYSVTSLQIDKNQQNTLAILKTIGLDNIIKTLGNAALKDDGLKEAINRVQGLMNLTNQKVVTLASNPDTQIVNGWTDTTNFVLPKFFYKTRTHNGFTFGGSFTAPSGLGMKWNGKGGEFLHDVFIMMVELAPSMSYTIKNRFSVGVGLRGLYATGSFNNTVYVPLEGASVLTANQILNLPNDVFADQVPSNMMTLLGNIGYQPALNCQKAGGDMNNQSCQEFYNGLKKIMGYSGLVEASANLYGTTKVVQKSNGKGLSGGYRVGGSLRVFDHGMFSVVYNSSVTFNMKGGLVAITELGPSLGSVLTKGNLNINVSLPKTLSLAYAHQFFKDHLRIEGVFERTFWSQGNKFLVTPDFANATYKGLSGTVASLDAETLKKMVGLANFKSVMNMGAGWRDTNTFRLGITYMGKSLRLMGAFNYDQAPSPQDAIGIPDSNGYTVALGTKYNFRGFDLGLAGSFTFKSNRSSLYQSPTIGQLRIFSASLGYRW
ncbi:OmpP1/FadL family transporter [Helicobacter acinonychis]|uniref:Outer membrane transport protein P1 n=2 Tax=Helicobacter acinonychis TaxID=212 RepID=Q17WL3_HELAH|nr:OmpP1/FadL family transporter [Helicobacter acinonychis]CAJ99963.1 outer membrane transport protein P1 [Helicobacter acinonychis str. Sheeba]SFZ70525.1 OMP879 [Helicobacter acinonychis]SFZ70914.1 OMP750 [Helicobacter acinonychis]STP04510.1 outer membrane transport protein P1 [Helicobacter acinonychis]